jgi:hypothetical protein
VFHVKAETIADTILGEAGGTTPASRYADMVAIAQVMENRATMLGVPMKDVVTASQFNAFGKSLPPGVSAYRGLAQQALAAVLANPTPYHAATFYATPAAVANLPKGLKAENVKSPAHSYFSDPQNRAIATAQGYKSPSRGIEAFSLPDTAPTPTGRTAAGVEALAAAYSPSSAAARSGPANASRGSSMAGPFGGNPFAGLHTEAMYSSPTISSTGRTPGFMTNPSITAPAFDAFRGNPVASFIAAQPYAPEDFGPSRAHNLGLTHGRPGYVAGVPAKSVATTSIGRPSMSPAEIASRYSPSSAASRLGVAKASDPASSRVAQAHAVGKPGPTNPAIAAALASYAASRMAAARGPAVATAPAVASRMGPAPAAPRGPAPAVMAYAPVAPAAKVAAPAFAPAPTGPLGLLGLMASLFGPGAGMGGLGIGGPGGPSDMGGIGSGYGAGGYGNPGYGGAHGASNYSGL